MKLMSIFFLLMATLAAARADLVIHQQSTSSNVIYTVILKFHGNKMRMDQTDTRGSDFSVLIDLVSHDSITLMPKSKTFRRHVGTLSRPEANPLSSKPVATGTTEKIGDYDTEIYTWSGTNGTSEKLWVAKNFPDYDQIQPELAKLDQFNRTGPHPAAQPNLSSLPGMVVQTQIETKGQPLTIRLVSAKPEALDAALFELPDDYQAWTPPTNSPAPPATK